MSHPQPPVATGSSPLVLGGQGRSASSVTADAGFLAGLLAIAAVTAVVAFACWILGVAPEAACSR